MPLNASGLQGIIYDYISVLISFFKADVFLLLGAQGMPLVFLLNFIFKKKLLLILEELSGKGKSLDFSQNYI